MTGMRGGPGPRGKPTIRAAAAMVVIAAAASPAPAADAEGKYSVDGVGRLDCARFLSTRAEDGAEFRLFVGWIDGYLSAFNHFQDETYDVTPWQTTELIVLKLTSYCEANPSTRFVAAVNDLLAVLTPQRLQRESPILRVSRNGAAVFLHAEIAARVRAELKKLGFAGGGADDDFGEMDIRALEAFQRSRELPVTGLPDQVTLNALFPR